MERKYLVFEERLDGGFNRYEVLAKSEAEAEERVSSYCPDAVSVKAFDWYIQFR